MVDTRSSNGDASVLTPARRRGVEILDDPSVDPVVRYQSHADIARSNRLLGGLRAAVAEIRGVLAGSGGSATLLDVGSGLADIPRRATAIAADMGVTLSTIALDDEPSLVGAARRSVTFAVCATGFALPFRDNSVDVVMCSQLLHHFDWADAERLLRELDRVACGAVIVSDLRRSWIAAAGFWVVAVLLRFHRVTRHDGVVSVLRGFTADDLRRMVRTATGATPDVRRRLGFRLTARWAPASARVRRDAA